MDSSTSVNTSLGLNLVPVDYSNHATDVDDDQVQSLWPNITAASDAGSTVLMAMELNRLTLENKKLTEMLTVLCENYNALETHVKELMITNQLSATENELMMNLENSFLMKKRKLDYSNNVSMIGFSRNTEVSSSEEESYKRPSNEMMSNINLKISRVYVRTDASDTRLIMKDGFQWRKYGQKVTRDNPSPRAYYKCSFAPSCPVKKKVQKSAENPCLLVATYEGEHNHIQPAGPQVITIDHQGQGGNPITSTPLPLRNDRSTNIMAPNTSVSSPSSSPTTVSMSSSSLVDDSTEPGSLGYKPNLGREVFDDQYDVKATKFQQLLVQQMACSLTKDPNFTTALAAAISVGRFNVLEQPHPRPPIPKWGSDAVSL